MAEPDVSLAYTFFNSNRWFIIKLLQRQWLCIFYTGCLLLSEIAMSDELATDHGSPPLYTSIDQPLEMTAWPQSPNECKFVGGAKQQYAAS